MLRADQIATAPLESVVKKKQEKDNQEQKMQEDMLKYRQMLERQALDTAADRVSQLLQVGGACGVGVCEGCCCAWWLRS